MATLEKIDLLPHLHSITTLSIARGPHRPELPYSGFNACPYVGDDPAHVSACRRMLAEYLGIPTDRLVSAWQRHTAEVAVITDPATAGPLDGIDALVTDRRGIALCIHTADCVPIVLADPEAGVIGAAHSGWRGTIASIAARTVEAMHRLGARPERIHAAMGPCICGDCYNVGEDVALQFVEKLTGWSDQVVRPNDQYHVDLSQAVRITLIQSGLLSDNITLPLECSHHTPGGRWPSARRLGIASPRTLTAILLK